VQDVVHHPPGVSDLETARLYSTNGSRANDGHFLLVCNLDQLPGVVLWYPLGNDGNCPDLLVLQTLEGGVIGRPEAGKTYHHIDLWERSHSVRHVLVDRNQDFLMTPVEVLLTVPRGHGVYHAGNARCLPPTHVVEVHHALNSSGLQSPDDSSGALGEQAGL